MSEDYSNVVLDELIIMKIAIYIAFFLMELKGALHEDCQRRRKTINRMKDENIK